MISSPDVHTYTAVITQMDELICSWGLTTRHKVYWDVIVVSESHAAAKEI